MRQNLKSTLLLTLSVIMMSFLAACDGDKNEPKPNPEPTPTPTPEPTPEPEVQPFHIVMASGSGGQSTTLLQAADNVTEGKITFKGKGYTLQTKRAPHLGFAPNDYTHVYYLNYRLSTIHKLRYDAKLKEQYVVDGTMLDPSKEYGQGLRFKVINEEVASAHEAIGSLDKGGESLRGKTIFNVMMVNLKPWTINHETRKLNMEVTLPEPISGKDLYVITRADSPIIEGDKIYYGVAIGKFNPDKPSKRTPGTNKTATLILDYPSLNNPTMVVHPEELGATNGYRTPTMYAGEDGYIYQMASTKDRTFIIRLKDGKYDTDYKYDLTKYLGVKGTKAYGWFYAGNGIGYIPYEDQGKEKFQRGVDPQGEPTYSAEFGVARMDLKNMSVVDLEVPEKMWLQQYQTVAIRDGKIYFALASFEKPGHVYIFDINSTSPQGTLGAELEPAGADQYYIGIH